MAVNIGPRIGIDGEAEYRKQLNNIIQQAKTLDSEMKAVTAQFGKNADGQDAMAEQSRILSQQIEVQQERVKQLEKGLSAASREYGETATQTLKWRQAVNEAKASLGGLESQLDGLDDAVDGVDDSMERAEKTSFGFGDALKANLTAGAIIEGVKSLAGAISDLVEETKEYQKIMGSLEVSGQKAGYTAEETAESYRTLYGVLADDQTAATTTANLQALGLSQQQLGQLINSTIGAWATYGDSIPIDGLAEAINETIRVGQVTGTFADVLNWGSSEGETFGVALRDSTEANQEWNDAVRNATSAEDYFNLALQDAGSQAERVNLVMQAMADQGLASAGRAWQENNESLVKSNQATADFQDNMSKLAERVEPVTTSVREGINRVLDVALYLTENVDFTGIAESISKGFSEFINVVVPKVLEFGNFLMENKDTIIAAVAGIGAGFAAWKVATLIDGVVTSIQAFKLANEGATVAQWAMNAAMNANPIVLIISLIAGLVTALITLWNTNEDFRNSVTAAWEAIKGVFDAVWGAITDFFTKTLPDAWNSVVEWFQGIPDWWAGIWESVGQFFEGIWNSIILFFTETIPSWIQSVIEWFNSLPEKIGYAIGQVLGHIIKFGQDAWNWVTVELPQIIEGIFQWFAQLPGKIWTWLTETVNKIVQWGSDMKRKAEEAVVNTFNTVVGWFKELPGNIWTWLTETVSNIGRWGSDMLQKAKEAVSNVVNSIVTWFKELPGRIVQIGKDIISGLWDGITSGIKWLGEKVSGFFGGLVDGVKDVLGIASPSKVFAEIGKFSGEGFEKGLSASMGTALKDAKREMQSGINGLDAAVSVTGAQARAARALQSSQSLSYGGFTINVYAADGQDENVIADRVAAKLQSMISRKEAVFG